MFEDVCLTCGKPVDVSQVYCSDDCSILDSASPSLSSVSSAHPSPFYNNSHAAASLSDVPALVLNSSRNQHRPTHARKRSSLSSSSASSVFSTPSAPPLTDDDDSLSDLDRDVLDIPHDYELEMFHATRPAGLSYARRPSATNTRSTIPVPIPNKPRSAAGTPSSLSHPLHSTSAPQYALDDADDNNNDNDNLNSLSIPVSLSSTPRRRRRHRQNEATLTSTKSKHNRGSLPSYFSLLQVGLASSHHHSYTSASPSSTLKQSLVDLRGGDASPDTPTAGRVSPPSGIAGESVLSARSRSKSMERLRRSRLNSIEKVQDWVYTATARMTPAVLSPPTANLDISELARGRQSARRRVASPERLVSTEPSMGLGAGLEGLGGFSKCNERGRNFDRDWERERGRTESRRRSSRRAWEFDWQPEGSVESNRGRMRSVAMRGES